MLVVVVLSVFLCFVFVGVDSDVGVDNGKGGVVVRSFPGGVVFLLLMVLVVVVVSVFSVLFLSVLIVTLVLIMARVGVDVVPVTVIS